jgi:hypothetical protein
VRAWHGREVVALEGGASAGAQLVDAARRMIQHASADIGEVI